MQIRAADAPERISGVRPVGIRSPSRDFSDRTLAITREMGLLHGIARMADGDPDELLEDGAPTGIVQLPAKWIRADAPFWAMDRFSAGRPCAPPSAMQEICAREFDGAHAEGGLFLLALHPHLVGRRSRIQALEALLRHIGVHDGMRFPPNAEIARHCKSAAGL